MFLIMVVIGILVFLTALDTGQWPSSSSEGYRDSRDRRLPKRVTPRRRHTSRRPAGGGSRRSEAPARWWWE